MTSPIFVDTNVPIYAMGRGHPLKRPSTDVLALAVEYPDSFLTDVEVLQELLHRYRALRIWNSLGSQAFEAFDGVMSGRVASMVPADVRGAAALVERHPRLSSRDLIHLAVMQRLGVTHLVTADKAFDRIDGITRLDPATVASWRTSLIES